MVTVSMLSATLLASGAACTSGTSAPVDQIAEGSVRVVLSGGLVQTVSLVPAIPPEGRNVRVYSVIVNSGAQPVALQSRICGLDYAGSLTLTEPPEWAKCVAYSRSVAVAVGDSVVVSDLMRVSSAPGQYELRVRHAIDPAHWVSMQVVVRSP